MTQEARILSVNVGRPREFEFQGKTVTSSIWKTPVEGPVGVRGVNLEGDDQADREVHGGPDKAIYSYAVEDIRWFQGELGRVLELSAFGENLTTSGIDVSGALIGETLGDRNRAPRGLRAAGPVLEARGEDGRPGVSAEVHEGRKARGLSANRPRGSPRRGRPHPRPRPPRPRLASIRRLSHLHPRTTESSRSFSTFPSSPKAGRNGRGEREGSSLTFLADPLQRLNHVLGRLRLSCRGWRVSHATYG